MPRTAPLRTRRGRRRQFLMAMALVVLCGTIASYWFLTDSNRVRLMAERYLSELTDRKVTVRKAHLSIFEGLRLEDVEVFVDEKQVQPDSRILSAKMFQVKTNILSLIQGKLESTQILAIQPVLYLCENVDSGEWNFSRRPRPSSITAEKPHRAKIPSLPQVLLRGGSVEYSRIQGGKYSQVGKLSIDGQLSPDPAATMMHGRLTHLIFDLEMRMPGRPQGPRIAGTVDLDRPTVSAALSGLNFDDTVRLMLPLKVQQWWDTHRLEGAVNIPRFSYSFGRKARPQSFEIEVQLNRVRLTVLPEEIMGSKAYRKLEAARPGIPVAAYSGLGLVGCTDALADIMRPLPIQLKDVSGRFVFTEDQIRFAGVTASVEGNGFYLQGHIDGYEPNSAAALSLVANNLRVPHRPPYLPILPPDVRREYEKFRPEGLARIVLDLRRERDGSPIEPTVSLNMLHGSFCFEEFLYPMHDVRGTVRFGRDPQTGWQRVDLIGIVGRGMPGTPNADREIHVDGWISPLDRRSRVQIVVRGQDVVLDQALRRALPHDAQDSLAMFDRHVLNKTGQKEAVIPVELFGDFEARITRGSEIPRKTTVAVDLDIKRAAGAFTSFAYPVEEVHGRVEVRPNYVLVKNVSGRHGNATLSIDGRVSFGRGLPVTPSLKLTARNVPIDSTLLEAFAPEQRKWLEKIGLGGTLEEVSGRIFRDEWAWAHQGPNDRKKPGGDDVDFDLVMKLRDGRIWTVDDKPLVTDITADLLLTRSQVIVTSAQGKRGQALVDAAGAISWGGDAVNLKLNLEAKDLFAGPMLYQIIPDEAREWWDNLRPAGVADVSFAYDGIIPGDEAKADARPGPKPSFDVSIRPKSMNISPTSFPWAMDLNSGELHITPNQVALKDIVLHHGDATIRLDGSSGGNGVWGLKLAGEKLLLDDALVSAAPKGIHSFLDAVKFKGLVAFDVPRLVYRATTQPAAAANTTAAQAVTHSYVGFHASIQMADGSMDFGAPLTSMNGKAEITFDIRDGDLYRMDGDIDVPALQLAGRKLKDLHCHVERLAQKKDANDPDYRFSDLHAKIAGGALDARIDLSTPSKGPSAYGMQAMIQDADIGELVGEKDPTVRGIVKTGRIGIQGNWGEPYSRRGSGDVIVEGKDLYRVPVLFGLLQIANLSLPIKSPFNEASATYVIDGPSQRVTLRPLELRSANMVMHGEGYLDFSTMKMEMVFKTENPAWTSVPLIGPMLKIAGGQLFEIRVVGRIQNPKVSSGAMNTFGTIIDKAWTPEPTPTKPKRRR